MTLPDIFINYCRIVARRKFFINISWKHSSGNWFLLLNITFQFARWLPNHLQYPPLGQVWSHGNWTRIGNCWENQEHARASPRWKITLDFFFLFFWYFVANKDKGGLRPLVKSNRHMTHIDLTNFLKIGWVTF